MYDVAELAMGGIRTIDRTRVRKIERWSVATVCTDIDFFFTTPGYSLSRGFASFS
jgi:hypothetical protein